MTFLHPWAIAAGVAAVGLPVLIHWLTRPRPVKLPLSTVRFVLEAVQQRRMIHRLRDIIVLALRTAAVVLVAWAFARPLWRSKPLIAGDEAGDAVRVVILDQSQSMAAGSAGISAFERARPVAAKYLQYRPGLRGNLILAGAQARSVFEKPSSNLAALREELAAASPRPQRLNLQAALNMAGEMLAASAGQQRRELVVISDFQRTNWSSADFSPLPKDTLIQLESLAPKSAPANLAILRVSPEGRIEQHREGRIEVEIGNYSPASREVQIELTVGRSTYRLGGLCAPGLSSVFSTPILIDEPGWQIGEAKLLNVEDALSTDNTRPFVLEVRATPTFVLITRQPSRPQAISSHYLERALSPTQARPGQQLGKVLRLDSDHADREALTSADLIVLDHPGRLPQATVNLLASLVRRGRAMLYVAAEPSDATNLKLFADAAGADLKMPVEFVPPTAGGQGRRGLFLLEIRQEEAPFAIFGDSLAAATGRLRFNGGLDSRRLEAGLADEILATYSDRSACLVVTDCAAGSLAVLNADLSETNLPASAAFVPLVGELTNRLLSHRRGEDSVPSGETLAKYLPADAGTANALKLIGPEQAGDALGSLVEENGFVLWRWNAAGPPGVYQVKRGNATVFALASAVPAAESDLRAMDPAVLKDRLAGGRQVHYQTAGSDEEKKDDAWAWALVACVACLLAELGVLRLFRA